MTTGRPDPFAELLQTAAAVGPALAPVGHREALQTLVESARGVFGAAACSIALLDDDQSHLVFTVAAGAGAAEVVGLRVPVGAGIAGWAVSAGQALEVADVSQDARFARDVAERTGYVPQAILAAPLETEAGVLGVVEVLDRDARRPGAEGDLLLLALIARHGALAVEAGQIFADMGRVLLAALVAAAPDLAAALDISAAGREPDADLGELAALFARLNRTDPDERRLAVRLVGEVVRHVERSRLR